MPIAPALATNTNTALPPPPPPLPPPGPPFYESYSTPTPSTYQYQQHPTSSIYYYQSPQSGVSYVQETVVNGTCHYGHFTSPSPSLSPSPTLQQMMQPQMQPYGVMSCGPEYSGQGGQHPQCALIQPVPVRKQHYSDGIDTTGNGNTTPPVLRHFKRCDSAPSY